MSTTSILESTHQFVDTTNIDRGGDSASRILRPDRESNRAPERSSRHSNLIGIAVAGALVLGGSFVAGLDDGPELEAFDGSMARVVEQVGARSAWAVGVTGAGVNVAVIDTGVAPVPALDGQIVATVDLSAEQYDPLTGFTDSFGHGTHMAGIIAGRAPGADPGADDGAFMGVAPGARIASVKVAGRDGVVTRDRLIAGVDWAIEHADQLDISVLTLAFDAPASGSYVDDPLAAALERAWNAGIVVVTSAGNAGPHSDGIAAPAYDPFVIAVAGVDGSGDSIAIPSWANRGDGVRNPDLAAPGAHIESLRAPGSDADVNHPEGFVDDERFLASGSSQATAVVAGTVALLLEARPELTPDQVKYLLTETARDLAEPAEVVGHGFVDLAAALEAPVGDVAQTHTPASAAAPAAPTTGIMSFDLDASRNGWTSGSWASGSWASGSWASGSWASGSWASGSWARDAWASGSWARDAWASGSWASGSWASGSWASGSWASGSWASGSWASGSWARDAWASGSWASGSWASGSWASGSWASGSWA